MIAVLIFFFHLSAKKRCTKIPRKFSTLAVYSINIIKSLLIESISVKLLVYPEVAKVFQRFFPSDFKIEISELSKISCSGVLLKAPNYRILL